jgi:uncharacterized protein
MERTLNLRPHHILCLRMFIGKGYDERFVDNMYFIQDRMEEKGVIISLASRCDDICSACPHAIVDVCEFDASVKKKDAAVLTFLDIPDGIRIGSRELRVMLEERLADLTDIGKVCGDCDWSSLCNEQLRQI